MSMKFFVLSRLLSACNSLLMSGYLAFALTVIIFNFKSLYTWEFISFIILAFVLCFIHHYLAVRVKFDADLLHLLSKKSEQSNIENLTLALDQSLFFFKLIPHHKMGRNWDLRFQGCLKIFKIQIFIVILQYLVLLTFIFNH